MAIDTPQCQADPDRAVAAPASEHIPRLQRLLQALCDDSRTQALIVECGDESLRETLIAHLDRFLGARGIHPMRLPLAPDDADAPRALETALAATAAGQGALHLLVPDAELPSTRWRALDVQLASLSAGTPARVILWLTPAQVRRLPTLMPRLCSGRSGTFRFEPAAGQPRPAPMQVPVRIGGRCLATQSRRIAELQGALAHDPPAPDEARLPLVEALAKHYRDLGEWDNLLRLVRDEELPLRRRLGDAHAISDTLRQLADIQISRGALAEALTLLREQCIPAMAQLGRASDLAALYGTLADVHEARGEADAALAIRAEKALPLHERLGDAHAAAVTQGRIADLYQAHGQLDAALRIRREEELPVFERLGDARATAITQGKIADALQERGELDAALRIRREETLPAYRHLGDLHAVAITQGKIGDVLQARGELDAALGAYEEVRAAFEQLGDAQHVARASGAIADVLLERGDIDAALGMLRTEELPVYERLGDALSLLVCRAKIALALLRRNAADDRTQAKHLLCQALADARRLRVPEAGRIEELLAEHGMDCAGTAPADGSP
ncbi:lipopolysaccharide assembly protein LapB [uncultured Thiohalocapsa sp.]|uniref:tetratricopeptide repeat protein n=1 Tax=uncultured Thiohalocapsa sp. TaxID=768990 RepID=UPI0025FD4B16|nr:tetratricopeptide repeat protein [uncultured Thiohalocapsa sp.]